MGETSSIWYKLGNINITIVYVATIVIAILAVAAPPVMPQMTPAVTATYDFIETLEPDDLVMLTISSGYAYQLMSLPQVTAVMHHIVSKNVNFYVYFHMQDGVLVWENDIYPALRSQMEDEGYEYGKNWVVLAFLPGEETAVSAISANTWILSKDFYGNPLEDLPLMSNAHSALDLKLDVHSGAFVIRDIRQMYAKYGTKILWIGGPSALARGPVYKGAGQIVSFLAGWEDAASYESLIKFSGLGARSTVVSSSFYLIIVILVIVGNLAWINSRSVGGKRNG